MAQNKVEDLRNHLFWVIEGLKANTDPNAEPQEKIDVSIASAITKAAHVIVESTKMEIELVRIMAKAGDFTPEQVAKTSNFIQLTAPPLEAK